MNTYTPCLIFSVDRFGQDNYLSRTVAEGALEQNGAAFAKCTGYYEGSTEECFLVVLDSVVIEALVRKLAKQYNQDSVLYLDSNRYTELQEPSGVSLGSLGRFVPTTKSEAQTHKGWTKKGNQYYICTGDSK